jgi:hypothetical protein
MTDRNRSEIDLGELTAHHTRLGHVRDRVNTAAGAGSQPIRPMAFGLFAARYGMDCDVVRGECESALRDALAATDDHIEGVRMWRDDVDMTEQEAVAMFEELTRDE